MGPADDRFTIIPDLDPVIHAVARLRVTVALAALPPGDSVTFPRLQELLALTTGNLSTHLRKLEDAGYVTSDKAYRLKKPVTYVALTEQGRNAFTTYRAAVRALVVGLDEPDPSTAEPPSSAAVSTTMGTGLRSAAPPRPASADSAPALAHVIMSE